MAFSVVASTSKASSDGMAITTDPINTIGADLIVLVASWVTQALAEPSDSESNTWTALTRQLNGFNGISQIFYVEAPGTGSSHTFTFDVPGFPGLTLEPWVGVIALSGRKVSGSFDQESGNKDTSGLTSFQPGSITPSENNAIWIVGGSAHVFGPGSIDSVDSPFSSHVLADIWDSGNSLGGIMAWEIQTTATARNPTVSWNTGDTVNLEGATFLSEPAGATGNPWYLYHQLRRQ